MGRGGFPTPAARQQAALTFCTGLDRSETSNEAPRNDRALVPLHFNDNLRRQLPPPRGSPSPPVQMGRIHPPFEAVPGAFRLSEWQTSPVSVRPNHPLLSRSRKLPPVVNLIGLRRRISIRENNGRPLPPRPPSQ
jgi:hypothetical protein